MSSLWSIKFKKKMMQLDRAFLDPETGKTYKQKESWQIHKDLMADMNADRRANGLKVIDIPSDICFDDWECRGYVHKETGRFMSCEEAVAWAEPYNEIECWWGGEGNDLQEYQWQIQRGEV